MEWIQVRDREKFISGCLKLGKQNGYENWELLILNGFYLKFNELLVIFV